MKHTRSIAFGILVSMLGLLGGWIAGKPQRDAGRVVSRSEVAGRGAIQLRSAVYRLDQVYMSMQGPRSNQPKIRVSPSAKRDETIWLTGLESNIIDAASHQPISNEFFCHSNLTLNPQTANPETHNSSFDRPTHNDWRFFTLVPGRMAVQLPEGFGIPVKNATLLDYYTMALNQNAGFPDRRVQMQTRLTYRRNDTGEDKIRPLFRRALYVYQRHLDESRTDRFCDGGVRSVDAFTQADPATVPLLTHHQDAHQGELCAETSTVERNGGTPSWFGSPLDVHPGATCCVSNASADGIVPQFGMENTVHWMVPPGRHQYRTEVTEQMQLPFDTSAHYVTGHLHPYGTSLRLVDLETDDVLFEITARSFQDRLGVQWVSELKSSEGIPIHRDHRYELIAEYENTLDRPIDAMGILYVYALDQPPASAPVR